ncbi:MAG TPA: helix-turn-helix domain-containing protein [Mycobacteriales bacterium]|jgi:DNA-binding transcriptional ArsR family regulator
MSSLRELGPEQLKALTHPIRVRMLKELRSNGPATATLLAARLGESSGATSYHLRQLERHGFVEDAPGGNGRERWWRAVPGGSYVATERWLDDPEHAAVLSVYQAAIVDVSAGVAAEWVRTQADWPVEWVEASVLNDYQYRMTAAQLKELTETVHRTIESFARRDDGPGTEQVVVTFHAFPRTVRPFQDAP